MLEAPLRDLLAKQLDILESGLEVLKIEQYIPSAIGTRSFIDILARDRRGRWVLVELKRSDAAAREAIHEVHKYVEAVKTHLGARDDEIRAIVVSTEWKELIVPFSRLANDTSISVLGIKLTISENSESLTAEVVETLPNNSGRVLSPWHEINCYKSYDQLLAGIDSYDISCSAKGIKDYVLLEMVATDEFYEHSVRALAHNLNVIKEKPLPPTQGDIDHVRARLDRLDHMLYFVPQLQSAEEYLQMTSSDPDMYEEAKGFFDDMEGDERLCYLQEYALDADPSVDRDHFEIGYPGKFKNKLLEDEGWTIRQVHRRGAFARNTVLTDDTIVREIAGEAGRSGQGLKRTVMLADRAEMAQLAKDIQEALPNNSVWVSMIRSQLEEAKKDFPESSVEVSIFAPSTGLLTLLFATSKEDGTNYIPSYCLNIINDGITTRLYVGELASANSEPKSPAIFSDIIERYYDGQIGLLTLSMTWGGYETRDIDVLDDLGIVYTSFRCDIQLEEQKFSRIVNGRWKRVEKVMPFAQFGEYLERNRKLVRTIFFKLNPRIGPICDGSSAAMMLENLVQTNCIAKEKHYQDCPDQCDLCLIPLNNEPFISDGRVDGQPAWANMCADCTVYHGAGIGWGTGQLYRKEPDGRWLMVAGGAPDEGEDELSD